MYRILSRFLSFFFCNVFLQGYFKNNGITRVYLPLSLFSTLLSLVRVTNLFIVCVHERRIINVPGKGTSNICRMTYMYPMLSIMVAPADHDTEICRLSPMLIYVSICHFSYVVYCINIRTTFFYFLSARLTQMWPRMVTVSVHEQCITKISSYFLKVIN